MDDKDYDVIFINFKSVLCYIYLDLSKPPFEAITTEIMSLENELSYFLDHLSEIIKPEFVEVEIVNQLDQCQIQRQPYGTTLVIGAWNYPIQLTLQVKTPPSLNIHSCLTYLYLIHHTNPHT